jgi:tetratricopeptide (TPR) repeat protein
MRGCSAIIDHPQAQTQNIRVYVYAERGNVYMAKGEYDRAIADFDEAILLKPTYSIAFGFRGNAYRKKGENDRAVEDYDQAIRLDPKNVVAYFGRGFVYGMRGDNDHAIEEYSHAIRFNPKDWAALNNRGDAYQTKGDLDRAIEDYDRAIRINPKHVAAYANRGQALFVSGKTDHAIADFEQAFRIEPTSSLGLFAHGAAYFAKGEIERAISDFDAAIRLDAKFVDALTWRGLVYSAKEDYARAIEDFNGALGIDSHRPDAFGGRAAAFEKLGDFARARADLHKVLEIRPNDRTANEALTRLAQIERSKATAQGSIASAVPPTPVERPMASVPSSSIFNRRVALVIGNGAYQSVPILPNPPNDAKAMAEMFRAAGFDSVDVAVNLGVKDMRHALREFADRAAAADAAVVYFAGHGVEIGGRDYLIPTDAVLRADIDVEDEAVELERVLQLLEPVKRLKLVILDACRDNPFRQSMRRTTASRAIGRGLSAPDLQSSDTLIAFAAKATRQYN